MINLDQLAQRIQAHQPKELTGDWPEAAVLLSVVASSRPSLVLTRRADHMNTHRGQVAFPGGKRDPDDADLLQTALREAQEEVALPASEVRLLGSLSDLLSLHGLKVRPYVGLIPDGLALKPCESELDAVFQVPLDWLLDDPRTHTDVIRVGGKTYYVPSYTYQGFTLWGLSAMMLLELMQVGFNAPIDWSGRPPGRLVEHPTRPLPPRP